MRSHGWPDATTTRDGADGGVDVTARGAVAQVKNWQNKVGIKDVQRLYACAMAERKTPLFFALTGYTAAAAEWADQNGVARFQMNPITPCNAPARAIAKGGEPGERWWRYSGVR